MILQHPQYNQKPVADNEDWPPQKTPYPVPYWLRDTFCNHPEKHTHHAEEYCRQSNFSSESCFFPNKLQADVSGREYCK